MVALHTCDFVCQPLPELYALPGIYLIGKGNNHIQVIHIGIVAVLQFDVLAYFVLRQNAGFQHPFDCSVDTPCRCIEQFGNLP